MGNLATRPGVRRNHPPLDATAQHRAASRPDFCLKIFGESRCRGGVSAGILPGDKNGINENMEVGSGPGINYRGGRSPVSGFSSWAGEEGDARGPGKGAGGRRARGGGHPGRWVLGSSSGAQAKQTKQRRAGPEQQAQGTPSPLPTYPHRAWHGMAAWAG